MAKDGLLECKDSPKLPGEYVVSLTNDRVNYLTIPDKLRILNPNKVAITDVHPRYLQRHHHNIRDVHFDVHLFGQNLLFIKQDYVRVYLDNETEAQQFSKFDVKDDIMALRVHRKPKDLLTIQIATDISMNEVQEIVKIKVVDAPQVHAQFVQVYEGESIDLRGDNLFD